MRAFSQLTSREINRSCLPRGEEPRFPCRILTLLELPDPSLWHSLGLHSRGAGGRWFGDLQLRRQPVVVLHDDLACRLDPQAVFQRALPRLLEGGRAVSFAKVAAALFARQ